MSQFLLLFLLAPILAMADINALYLSWYEDPTTTITIQWHTDSEESEEPDDEIHLQLPDGEWVFFTGSSQPFIHEYFLIHTLKLQDLEPDTLYHFKVGKELKIYSFRTAPQTLDKPLRFIVGGDLYISPELFRMMNRMIVKQDPLFAVLGGDLAYAIRNPFRFRCTASSKWRSFLTDWTRQMVTPEGRLIPFLIVAGNHDIARGDPADLFFSLFAFPERTLYRSMDFGNYLSLILLDTGYITPIEGTQTRWLEKTLQDHENIPFCFPVYHEGAYPSFYPYNNQTAKKVRTNWCTLFNKYGVRAAFEHHSHTYKRTYPLKAGKIDPTGTIYLGDGCWGVPPRTTNDLWYLEKRGSSNHVYLLEMNRKSCSVKALGLKGEILDEFSIPARD